MQVTTPQDAAHQHASGMRDASVAACIRHCRCMPLRQRLRQRRITIRRHEIFPKPPTPEKIELWPLDRLIPYARNPRTHSDAQVAQIAASIVEFGFNNPILVDSNSGVIAGHGRLLAARKLGLERVPVVVLDHLTENQKRAYILADNQLALNAGWDEELLRGVLAELRDADFNLDLIGFDETELDRLLTTEPTEGLTAEDACPEPLEDPVSRRGDLWLLSDHRLLCGDSAKREDVDRLVEGGPVDLVNTDPPYNVRVEPRSNNAIAAGLSSFAGLHHHQSFDVHRGASKAKGTTKKMRPGVLGPGAWKLVLVEQAKAHGVWAAQPAL